MELLVILGCGDEVITKLMDTLISEVSKHWSNKILCAVHRAVINQRPVFFLRRNFIIT